MFDLGLEDGQRDWLRGIGAEIVRPGWDIASAGARGLPEHYKALTVRPFLPRHFPGHGTYLWIDADAWVQEWSAVELLLRAAADGAIACVPELDRSYRGLFEAWEEYHGVVDAAHVEAFGEETGRALARLPLVNSGVFALRAGSPSWRTWAQAMEEAFARTANFLAEQSAFNLAVHRRGARAHFLPSWCNWAVHHAAPCWDAGRERFVEPLLPHQTLGIVHLTVHTKRQPTLPVRQLGGARDGEVVEMRVRFSGAPDQR